jgi:antirestriction protein
MLNIFVNTWGNYNTNGADGGEWITLPVSSEELTETLDRIASNMRDSDPEWTIHDYEWEGAQLFPVSEYDNIGRLNDILTDAADLEECELLAVSDAIDALGYTFAEALEAVRSGEITFYPGQTLEDVAHELVEECYNLPEIALRYFDYSAFARDLGFDGYTETEHGVICC